MSHGETKGHRLKLVVVSLEESGSHEAMEGKETGDGGTAVDAQYSWAHILFFKPTQIEYIWMGRIWQAGIDFDRCSLNNAITMIYVAVAPYKYSRNELKYRGGSA